MRKKRINEVKQLQKTAGILKEDLDLSDNPLKPTHWTSELNPEINGIEIYNDGYNRLFVIFDKRTGKLHVINDWNGEDYDEIWGSDDDIRPDLLTRM